MRGSYLELCDRLAGRVPDPPGRVLIGDRPERGRTRTVFRYQTQAVHNPKTFDHIDRVSQGAFDERLLCLLLALKAEPDDNSHSYIGQQVVERRNELFRVAPALPLVERCTAVRADGRIHRDLGIARRTKRQSGSLLHALGVPLSGYWRLKQHPCAINEIDITEGGFVVVTVNETYHLRETA